MPTIFFFIILLLLSSAPHRLSCTQSHTRRILHEPFFPLDSLPPSESPSTTPPKTTKYPFSGSTPVKSPFFPADSSPPSPPPSPSPPTFASFPANISSLILPHTPSSKRTSPKLVAATVSTVVILVGIVVFFFFFFWRRRRIRGLDDEDDKSFMSSDITANSNRLFPPNAETRSSGPTTTTTNKKLRPSASTSSEFLYLGTLVNSRSGGGIDDRPGLDARKLASPELHPLPPLARQANGNNGEEEEEDEEFYSPRVSLGGSGSGSRRAFAAVGKIIDLGSSCSYSCSTSESGSPARSHSISLSPPISWSPNRRSSQPKSKSREENPEPSASANETTISPSPTLPAASSLQMGLGLEDQNPENENVSSSPHPNRHSPTPSLSSSSSSHPISQRRSLSPRISNVSQRDADPVAESPSISNASSCSSSPERALSPTRSNVWDQNAESVKVCAPPPPPPPTPPPPPPLPIYRHWEAPKASTPISKPPSPLIPPLRPFVLQKPTIEVSPIELPPASSVSTDKMEETTKPKLKPLHWDKVRASSDREMVWDHLRSSSFKLNEEMIETLFLVNTPNSKPKETTTPRWALPSPNQENRVLDPKKSQNIAISLRALNVTMEEVCDALLEGNADTLGTELLESLLKMAPTKEEERKLKEYKDDSPIKLGPAEKFLKAVIDVPFAFKRVDAMLYIANFDSEVEYLKKSFETLEAACEELRNSRMFLKLLEAVLKTGNRMNVGTNRGDAHAFKLDTLLKLVDVKGADGKTTLLHFVVQEIIRTEGARLSGTNQTPNSTLNEDAKCRKLGLQVVSSLSSELTNVKKAAAMDSDVLCGEVAKLSSEIGNIREVVQLNETMGSDESRQRFSESMNRFMKIAEEEIIRIQAQESVALSLVKEITEYFHGNSAKEEAHPFRIFMVVRDFLTTLDRVCKEVSMINERTIVSSAHKFPVPVNPMMPQVIPGFPVRRQCSSSDDETASP